MGLTRNFGLHKISAKKEEELSMESTAYSNIIRKIDRHSWIPARQLIHSSKLSSIAIA